MNQALAILDLASGGIIALIVSEEHWPMGHLVRALDERGVSSEIYVHVAEALEAKESLAIFWSRSTAQHERAAAGEQIRWYRALNANRPALAGRRLFVWCNPREADLLARTAPDFFDWISHRIDVPEGPPPFAVEALRSAPPDVGIEWRGGWLDESIREAAGDVPIVRVRPRWDELLRACHTLEADVWIVIEDVVTEAQLIEARWALAEAGRKGRTILAASAVPSPGWWPVRSTSASIDLVAAAGERIRASWGVTGLRWLALLFFETGALECLCMLAEVYRDGRHLRQLVSRRRPLDHLAKLAVSAGQLQLTQAFDDSIDDSIRQALWRSIDRQTFERWLEAVRNAILDPAESRDEAMLVPGFLGVWTAAPGLTKGDRVRLEERAFRQISRHQGASAGYVAEGMRRAYKQPSFWLDARLGDVATRLRIKGAADCWLDRARRTAQTPAETSVLILVEEPAGARWPLEVRLEAAIHLLSAGLVQDARDLGKRIARTLRRNNEVSRAISVEHFVSVATGSAEGATYVDPVPPAPQSSALTAPPIPTVGGWARRLIDPNPERAEEPEEPHVPTIPETVRELSPELKEKMRALADEQREKK